MKDNVDRDLSGIISFLNIAMRHVHREMSVVRDLQKQFGRYLKDNIDFICFAERIETVAGAIRDSAKLKQCQAEDCTNLFIPQPSGKTQKYCRNACKIRAYRKRKKAMAAV